MNNEMTLTNRAALDISNDLNEGSSLWFSRELKTLEDKISVYNAVNQADFTIKENVNKPIYMVDVVVSIGNQVDESGEVTDVPRICIFDKDGKTYHAMSWGVYRSICRIRSLFGTLHFDEPLKVVPAETKTKNGFALTLKIDK